MNLFTSPGEARRGQQARRDTYTQWRGVWLERGELKKLATLVGSSEGRSCLSSAVSRIGTAA